MRLGLDRVRAIVLIGHAMLMVLLGGQRNEGKRFHARIRLMRIAERIEKRLAQSTVQERRLREVLARVQQRLGCKEEAAEQWSVLARMESQRVRDHALLQWARLELSRGRRMKTAELLDDLSAAAQGRAACRRLQDALERARSQPTRASVLDLALAARRALRKSGEEEFVERALEALRAKHRKGFDEDAMRRLLVACYQFANGRMSSGDEVDTTECIDRPDAAECSGGRVIFCAGFGWSGSGAVFDYLCGQRGVDAIVGRTEFCGVESPDYGVNYLLSRIEDKARVFEVAVVDLVWAGLLGLPFRRNKKKYTDIRNSLLECWIESRDLQVRLSHETMELLRNIQIVRGTGWDAGRFKQILGAYTSRLLRPRSGYAASVVNNVVHGHRLWLLGLIPDSIGIAVMRDPGDQFVAREYESNRRAGSSPDEFIVYQKKILDQFLDWFEGMKGAPLSAGSEGLIGRVKLVRFESFVSNVAVREEVAAFAGVGKQCATGYNSRGSDYFNPKQSSQNVGICTNYPDAEAIRRIHDELDDRWAKVEEMYDSGLVQHDGQTVARSV